MKNETDMDGNRRPYEHWFLAYVSAVGAAFDLSVIQFISMILIAVYAVLYALGFFLTASTGAWGFARESIYKSTIPCFFASFVMLSATIIRFEKPDWWAEVAYFYLAAGVLFYVSALIEVESKK